MALGDMKRDILNDAEAKASAVDQEAGEESEKVIRAAKEQAKKVLDGAKAEAQKWAESFVMEHGAEIQIDRHNSVLLAKEEAIDANIGAVLRALTSEITQNYTKIVQKAIEQLRNLGAMAQGILVIKAEERYMKQLNGLGVPVEPDHKGIAIESRDGKIKLDLSPDTLIRDVKDDIRLMIAVALFEEGEKANKPQKKVEKLSKKMKKIAKKAKKIKKR